MSKVTEILSMMPHVNVVDTKGKLHVIPLIVIQNIATGRMPVTDLDGWQDIIPVVVKEWSGNLIF